MKPDILIDAMEYIGDDLLEAADSLRTGQRSRFQWKRYTALAASVCIIAGGVFVWNHIYGFGTEETESIGLPETGAAPTVNGEVTEEAVVETEAADDGAPLWKEEILAEVIPENVQYIRTDGYHEDVQYPVITLIHSAEELDAYYNANRERYNLERRETVYADTTIGFLDACDLYDADYFAGHDLLLVLLEEGSGSIRHEVGALTLTENGWTVDVIQIEPEICTDDMAQWHLMIEVEKGLIGNEEKITAE